MKMAIMGLDIVDWESAQVDLHTLSIVKQLLLITLHFLAQDLYSSIRWWTPWNSWARRKTSRKCWSLPTAKSTWCDFKQTAARVHGSRRHTMRAHCGRTLCSLTSLSSSVVDARVNSQKTCEDKLEGKLGGPKGGRVARFKKIEKSLYRTMVSTHSQNFSILAELESV